MTAADVEEYKALRSTIRERGTTRVWVVLVGIALWAFAGLAAVALVPPPLVTFLPLLVLATTFEVVFALHVGVERIGRYIQVFFEGDAGPAWEHRIMEFGRGGPPAAQSDPLFAWAFWCATLLNVIPALLVGPLPVEWAVLGTGHVVFALRVAVARRIAAAQRVDDLARFQKMKNGERP